MAESQGDRVRIVREAMGKQQGEFADALNTKAAESGLRARYDNTAISKLENGRRDLSVNDLFLIAALDPKQRGERWLAYGTPTGHGPRSQINGGEGKATKRKGA